MDKIESSKKPNHKIVSKGSLKLNDEAARKLTQQVSQFVRKGSLPASVQKKQNPEV